MSKRTNKPHSSRPAPITAEDLERYARDLVERKLASPRILGPRPRWNKNRRGVEGVAP